MRRIRRTCLLLSLLLLLAAFPFLSGCTHKKSELEAYLEAAYPSRSFSEDGRYFIRRPDGSRFAVETENHEEKNWDTLGLLFESIESTVDAACVLNYALDMDIERGGIAVSYGWRPQLQVFLDGDWWNMESGEGDLHPQGVAVTQYGTMQHYLYALTSRETLRPLPDGKYRIVFDFGELYDACCLLEFTLEFPDDAKPLPYVGMAAQYPEAYAWLRRYYGDYVRADGEGNLMWHLPGRRGITTPVEFEKVEEPVKNEALYMEFTGLEARLGFAPVRILPASRNVYREKYGFLGMPYQEKFQTGLMAAFKLVNNTGRSFTFDQEDDYASHRLQVQLEGYWWTIYPMHPLGSVAIWWIIEPGESTQGCQIRSPWTGQQLPEGHYRYCIEGWDRDTREPIRMQAEFDLGW